jgi:hypothetical protein
MTWEEPRKMKRFRYAFSLLRPGIIGFSDSENMQREFNVDALAEHLLKVYMDEVETFKRR